MSRGAQLLQRHLCSYKNAESFGFPVLSSKVQKGFRDSTNVRREQRRMSLTLATAWGEPYTGSSRNNAVRQYHQAVTQTERVPSEDVPDFVQHPKRKSSQMSGLSMGEATSVSACPYQALFAPKSKAKVHETGQPETVDIHSRQKFNKQTISATYSVTSAIRHLITSYCDKQKLKLKQVRHLFTSMKKVESSATGVKSYSTIPGPRGLPLLGSVLDYTFLGPFSPRQFHKALRSRHSKYGKIFREKFLSEEFVYTSDPADVQILAHNEEASPCRPHIDAIVESRTQQGYPVGITAMQGDEWGRLRKALNSAIMKPKIVRSYAEAQKKVADDFVQFMRRERNDYTGEIAEFEAWLNRWAMESVAVILLDTRLGLISQESQKSPDPVADQLRKAMDVFFDYGARLTFSVPLWKLWKTKDWKIFCRSQRDEFECAGHYVDKKLSEIKSDSSPLSKTEKPSSFLEHLLNHTELERDESVTLCLELLAGGIDTSSNAITFTLFELAKNKEQQEKLRELILKDGDNAFPGTSAESSRYLRACVMEAIRLHPLTYVNMRKTNRDLVLSGHRIPAGTTVRYTPHLMHLRNEEYFPRPDEYIPDRWVDKASPFKCKSQFVFTPFGHGARQCPGRRIAEQEFDLLLRAILLNFRVDYHHDDIGVQVRLFNSADKPARFSFIPLSQ